MAGYLIKETTCEERKQIVEEALGNLSASCDGCMAGLADMYQDYIDGKKEIRDINMEFNARYERETWIGKKEEAARCQCKGKKIETISKERFGRRNWKENTI